MWVGPQLEATIRAAPQNAPRAAWAAAATETEGDPVMIAYPFDLAWWGPLVPVVIALVDFLNLFLGRG
ncbi:hypothetical protein M2280_001026 [Prescottella agglutinans]|uniref:Uncharacterized protein n=1 Tax=Prescottella agglutinans TaxID=1644129 RepID=A0ABT6M684_9NOCA|nr:hypothetical protein [Prescottella agglutinans]